MGGTIVLIAFTIIIVFTYIHEIINDLRYKEIEKRGIQVKGKVVKLKYLRRQFIKTGRCRIVASCEIESERRTFKTLSDVDDYDYSPGDEINLLYLDEYPKLIIIDGVPSMTNKGFVISTIIITLIVIFMGHSIKESYIDYKMDQEIKKSADEFMRSLENKR